MSPPPRLALLLTPQCIELSPSFVKGYARKGAALHGMRRLPDAVEAYEAGLQLDSANDICKRGLADVKRAMEAATDSPFGPGGDMGLGKMFSDPMLVAKLENNPKTREHMKDPAFRAKVAALQSGKSADLQGMMADPRMLTVLGVAMGIDIVGSDGVELCKLTEQDAMERPAGSNEMPPGMPGQDAPAASSSSRSAPDPVPTEEKPKPKPAAEPVEEDVPMEDDDANAKKEADELKAKGNVAYKGRKFDEAIEAYSKAWEVYPKDVTFLTNLSGQSIVCFKTVC